MTIGNGGGVELKLNGESLGVPGKTGKVVRVKIPKDAKLLRLPEPSRQAGAGEGDLEVDTPAEDKVSEVDSVVIEDDGFD